MPPLKSQRRSAAVSFFFHRWRDFLLASVTALLIAAPAFVESLWPLTWIGLVPCSRRNVSPQQAFLLGWWAETLMIWLGYWLVGTMVRFGYSATSGLLFLGVVVSATGCAWDFSWWICHSLGSAPWWYRFLLLPCAYVALDYLFPQVFPWYLDFSSQPCCSFRLLTSPVSMALHFCSSPVMS
jgi:hypothetical protein